MTKIEWTNETWNPIVGCSKISQGCDNCYAEKMAYRLTHILGNIGKDINDSWVAYSDVIKNKKWNGKTQLVNSALDKPTKWKKPRMIFVCSMGDLFHESISFVQINTIFSIMSDVDHHIYQVLTKRPDRVKKFFEWKNKMHEIYWQPKNNIWFGVTAENQEQADKRIHVLLQIPAALRFISCEPMLSQIDLSKYIGLNICKCEMPVKIKGKEECFRCKQYLPEKFHPRTKIDWVICGGESGAKARPMHPDWVRSLRDQCKTAHVPFFFKQWGEWEPRYYVNAKTKKPVFNITPSNKEIFITDPEPVNMYRSGKNKAGRKLDGIEYTEFPILK